MKSKPKEDSVVRAPHSLPDSDFIWKYEDAPVIVDFPEKFTIPTNKISVLEPFLKQFEKTIANRSRVLSIKDLMYPMAKEIKEIDSIFACFSEVRSKIEIVVLLNNRKYDRELSGKLFDIRLALEDKFVNQQIDFFETPRFDREYGDIVSKAFEKIYP
jgi:hypothetical protein